MATVKVFDQTKKEVGEIRLSEDIFEVPVKEEILHLVVRAHLAAKRVGTVGVKNRSASRGGGKKPWRQKGTGRARAGTIRSPLWVGGAVAHGPKARDYSFKINKKIKTLALKMALSSKVAEGNFMVIDEFKLDKPKTKEFAKIKNDLELKKALIVVPDEYNNLELSARNIPGIRIQHQSELSVHDILAYPQLVMAPKVVETIQERLK